MNLDHFATFFVGLIAISIVASFTPNILLQLLMFVFTFGGWLLLSLPDWD